MDEETVAALVEIGEQLKNLVRAVEGLQTDTTDGTLRVWIANK